MNRADAAKVIIVCRTLWPHATIVPADVAATAVADAWGAVLDVPVEQAIAAVTRIARAGERFPPTVGQIRQACVEASTGDAMDIDAVWAEIADRIRRVGWFAAECASREGRDALCWSHPIVAACVEALGGFKVLCLSPQGDSVVRAQLRQAHAAVAGRTARDAAEAGSVDWSAAIGSGRSPREIEAVQ